MASSSDFIKTLNLPTMKEINVLKKRKDELYKNFRTFDARFFDTAPPTKEFRTSRDEWYKTQDGKEYKELVKKLDKMFFRYDIRRLLRRYNISSIDSLLNKLVQFDKQLSYEYLTHKSILSDSQGLSDTSQRHLKELNDLLKVDKLKKSLGIKE